jgi:type I restriction enzyme R subunit
VKVIDIETRYIDPETGKFLSSKDFLMKLVDRLPMFYRDEAQLRKIWSNPETRDELLAHLATIGIGEDQLADLARMFEAENSDIFDILAHLSYGTEIRYRTERRDIASGILDEYESLDARAFIEFLFTLYVRNGILEFRKDGLSKKIELFGRTPRDLAAVFGGNGAVKEAYYRVQEGLYFK